MGKYKVTILFDGKPGDYQKVLKFVDMLKNTSLLGSTIDKIGSIDLACEIDRRVGENVDMVAAKAECAVGHKIYTAGQLAKMFNRYAPRLKVHMRMVGGKVVSLPDGRRVMVIPAEKLDAVKSRLRKMAGE